MFSVITRGEHELRQVAWAASLTRPAKSFEELVKAMREKLPSFADAVRNEGLGPRQ